MQKLQFLFAVLKALRGEESNGQARQEPRVVCGHVTQSVTAGPQDRLSDHTLTPPPQCEFCIRVQMILANGTNLRTRVAK